MPITKFILDTIEKKDVNTIRIDLSNQGLFDNDLDVLITALNNNPIIQALDLYRNNLGNGSSQKLAQLKHIKILNLSANNFSDEGIMPLITNASIVNLDLSRNNLSDNVATLISEHAVQQSINVSENDLSTETLKKIADTTRINRAKSKPEQLLVQENKKTKLEKDAKQQFDQQSPIAFFSHEQQEKQSFFQQTSKKIVEYGKREDSLISDMAVAQEAVKEFAERKLMELAQKYNCSLETFRECKQQMANLIDQISYEKNVTSMEKANKAN